MGKVIELFKTPPEKKTISYVDVLESDPEFKDRLEKLKEKLLKANAYFQELRNELPKN